MRAVLFHNVVAGPVDPFDRLLERLHVRAFQREIDYLRSRYRIVSLPEAMAALDRGQSDPDALVLTFDDGFAGVLEVAQPVLAARGLVAAVFVLTDGRGGMPADRILHFEELEIAFRLTARTGADFTWLAADAGAGAVSTDAERVRALRAVKRQLKRLPDADRLAAHARVMETLGVSPSALREAADASPRFRKLDGAGCRTLHGAGWTIGGHTLNHPSLRQLDAHEIARELEGNARDLAALGFLAAPLAYPYGGDAHVDARVQALAERAGFTSGWTTVPGDNDPAVSRFALRRFSLPALHAEDLALHQPLPARPHIEVSS